MGGRIAEEMVLNRQTTGAANDIERATAIARRMVCEWGMSERLGPLTFGKREEHLFLGREIARHQDYSEQTAIEIDREVRSIVEGCYQKTKQLLTEHLDILHAIAQELLEKETLQKADVDRIIESIKPGLIKLDSKESSS
jgi:cell division protease FtsH